MFEKFHQNRQFVWFLQSLVLIGSLNWLSIGAFQKDLLINVSASIRSVILVAVGVAAMILLFTPSISWLPFLGESAFPTALLTPTLPSNTTHSIPVKVLPNALVVYWLSDAKNSDPSGKYVHARQAYKNTDNAGTVYADSHGMAVLSFRWPIPYSVSWGKIIQPHVHYRYASSDGMLSPVVTVML